ncbi:hypothetical protein TrCOL_g1637 [Triparma columacea]|uniref:Vacuolar protein 8 n=1 Tax=Triparma columacea TaxID=722753 RepID=A0A9W7LDM5_9STRA|nr:hypothetical protein TrCOL_g1637 [Triparma columacea]
MSKNQETALKKGLTFPAGASQPQPQGSLGEKGPSLQGIKGLFKPYKGDLFGTNGNKSGGLLYLSRMNVEDDPKVKAKTEAETKKRMELLQAMQQERESLNSNKAKDPKDAHIREKKRRFAMSLATLASKHEKRHGIVEAGAIVTLATLSKTPDSRIRLSCAAAFNSLAMEPSLRKAMLEQGAVQAIVGMHTAPIYMIRNNCARALCNLSASDGSEEELVKQGAVPALLNLSQVSAQLMEVVMMALLNLSCVHGRYSKIDEVNDAVIHMGGSDLTARIEKLLISAIVNLTALKSNQARLVEENVLRILTRIQKNNPLEIQRMVATAFANLSSCSRSRGKMTDGPARVVETLLNMVEEYDDEEIKRQCALTVSRLALDVSCREKILQQSAVKALVKMSLNMSANGRRVVETDRVCAAALNVLAADGESSEKLIHDGAVDALLALMKNGDKEVRTECAHCLCVLFDYEKGIDEMIDKGAVQALIELADPQDLRTSRNCSMALYNLLGHEEAGRLNGEGILSALVKLSHSEDVVTKSTCAAALWELTELEGSDPRELIPALIKMLNEADDSQIKGDCAAALYNLAHDESNCELMMKHNCLEPLLTLVESEHNFSTRVQCGAILSRLSFDVENRELMSNQRAIDCIYSLLNLEPPPGELDAGIRVLKTQQRMVNAIYNISCNEAARPLLLSSGAGKFLTESQTKPAENIRRGCAAALCNLLVEPGTELDIMNSGAVSALLITALVASDKEETKKICVKCLYNLLSEGACHKPMVDEGVLWGFAALSKSSTDSTRLTPDVEVTRICSKAFCNLACKFGKELMGSTACVKTLLWLTALDDQESKENATRGVLNVLKHLEVADAPVAIQSIKFLKVLAQDKNERIKGLVVLAFCMISQFEDVREQMKSQKALSSIDFEVVRQDAELSYAYASTACNMTVENTSSNSIVNEREILDNLFELSLSVEERTVLVVAKALYACTCDRKNIPALVGAGVVQAVQELLLSDSTLGNVVVKTFLSSILFNVSTEVECNLDVVNKDAVQMLRLLWENGDGKIKRVCALTCANLSCGVVNSAKIVRQQGTEMIVNLVLREDLKSDDGKRCVAALRNLLSTSANHRPMLKEDVVDALVKLAESKVPYISLNAAAALRTMTYNEATREALIEKNAIKVIIEDTNGKGGKGDGGDEDDDLQIGNKLLQQIEAESWSNGSRGIQREGRAQNLEVAPLIQGLSESEAILIELPEFWIEWHKVGHDAVMEEPQLEIKPMDTYKGDSKRGSGNRSRKESSSNIEGRDIGESELKMSTRLCPKMECDVVLGGTQEDRGGHKADFLDKIETAGEQPNGKLPFKVAHDRRRKLSGTSFDVAGEGRALEFEPTPGVDPLVLPSIALTQSQGGVSIF